MGNVLKTAYIVHRSNCEPWEDYHTWVDSAWASRELAVSHIESDLGMTQRDFANPDRPWARDRWSKHNVAFYVEDDFRYNGKLDEEEWEEYRKDPYPAFEDETDAWIEEFVLYDSLEAWKADWEAAHGKDND